MSNPIFTPEEMADIARLKRNNNWTNEELAAYLQGKPMNNQDKPAFPVEQFDHMQEIYTIQGGMSLREYAAIKLRVPDSGTDWLDAMIEKSLLNEFAGKAMNGLVAKNGACHYADAYELATAMLKASKGE